MRIGNREFDTQQHTYIMGILNVTPDSFSDGGQHAEVDAALRHAEQMVAEGVDIIDVGGESTRPGYTQVSAAEEIQRVAPVIEAIKTRFDVPVSLDTYKASVAQAGIAAGADMINDIWGVKHDIQMAQVIARGEVACCLMHNRREVQRDVQAQVDACEGSEVNIYGYTDFLEDVKSDLQESINLALAAGILRNRIMLDPGVGFAKSYEQNLLVLRHLEEFQKLGYPVLLGTSKKSVIGRTLDVPTEQRGAATLATTALAIMRGCSFVRVHDVEDNVHAIKMMEAILYG